MTSEKSGEMTSERMEVKKESLPDAEKHLPDTRRHDFDFTMMSTFLLCPRKYDLRFNKGKVLKTPQTAPDFGKGIHAALDEWYTSKDVEKAKEVFRANFTEQLEADGKRTYKLGEWMIENYAQTYVSQPWELLQSEMEFTIPFEGVNFIGRIDKIIKWGDGVWVVDHKTTSALGPTYVRSAEPNAQFTGYVWAARRIGFNACGIILDVLSTASGLLEASRRAKLTAVLRYDSYRSEAALREWEEEFILGVARVRDCEFSGRWPASGMFNGACTYYGECPFRKVCCEDKEVRERYLEVDYNTEFWDPRG